MPDYQSDFEDHDLHPIPPLPNYPRPWPLTEQPPSDYSDTPHNQCEEIYRHWTTGDTVHSRAPIKTDPDKGRIAVLACYLIDRNIELFDLKVQLNELTRRYNDVINTSIAAVVENEGCMSGKIEVLEAKGFVWRPTTSYRLNGGVDIQGAEHGDIESILDMVLSAGGLTQTIVDRFLNEPNVKVEDSDGIDWEESDD